VALISVFELFNLNPPNIGYFGQHQLGVFEILKVGCGGFEGLVNRIQRLVNLGFHVIPGM
jgi:hypothetical protein